MAYRKITKKFDIATISEDIKIAVIMRGEENAVGIIAEHTGLKPRTIYDYLDGRIKPSLDFIHAALIATEGDPEIRKYLEPEGWVLTKATCEEPSGNIEKEIGDIYVAVSQLHMIIRDAIRDGKITTVEYAEILRANENLKSESDQIIKFAAKG